MARVETTPKLGSGENPQRRQIKALPKSKQLLSQGPVRAQEIHRSKPKSRPKLRPKLRPKSKSKKMTHKSNRFKLKLD